jgi:hypothetical protein
VSLFETLLESLAEKGNSNIQSDQKEIARLISIPRIAVNRNGNWDFSSLHIEKLQ